VLAKPSSCADAAEETGRRLPNSFPEEGLVMQVVISETKGEMGRRAAETGADKIRAAIARNGAANVVVATGASQFEMLEELVRHRASTGAS
jgi:hypothetical protein